ncbi:MAG TPA: SPW repeat protein [Gammaproteobacteria bacterium]|nr:SPW repeat protein [Gammaproteobacteria bacterium]
MKTHWENWTNIVLGVWLVASTWELQYAHMSLVAWNSYLAGFAVTIIAAAALTSPSAKKEMTNMGLGVWLMASPWLLETHHHVAATANTFSVGILVFLVASFAAYQESMHRVAGSPR